MKRKKTSEDADTIIKMSKTGTKAMTTTSGSIIVPRNSNTLSSSSSAATTASSSLVTHETYNNLRENDESSLTFPNKNDMLIHLIKDSNDGYVILDNLKKFVVESNGNLDDDTGNHETIIATTNSNEILENLSIASNNVRRAEALVIWKTIQLGCWLEQAYNVCFKPFKERYKTIEAVRQCDSENKRTASLIRLWLSYEATDGGIRDYTVGTGQPLSLNAFYYLRRLSVLGKYTKLKRAGINFRGIERMLSDIAEYVEQFENGNGGPNDNELISFWK